jgi:hypothetical protein
MSEELSPGAAPVLPEYELTLKGEGVSVSRKVGEPVARAILDLVMGGILGPRREIAMRDPREQREAPSQAPSRSISVRERLSLREYLDEVGAVRNPDKITAIGQYMLEHEDRDLFSRDDVKSRFRTAGEGAPGNFPRDFSVAIGTGWISEDPKSAGNFYVTKKGREALEGRFVANIRRPASRKRRKDGTDGPPDEGDVE